MVTKCSISPGTNLGALVTGSLAQLLAKSLHIVKSYSLFCVQHFTTPQMTTWLHPPPRCCQSMPRGGDHIKGAWCLFDLRVFDFWSEVMVLSWVVSNIVCACVETRHKISPRYGPQMQIPQIRSEGWTARTRSLWFWSNRLQRRRVLLGLVQHPNFTHHVPPRCGSQMSWNLRNVCWGEQREHARCGFSPIALNGAELFFVLYQHFHSTSTFSETWFSNVAKPTIRVSARSARTFSWWF